MKRALLSVVAALTIVGATAFAANDCACRDNCSTSCTAETNGCCGCGVFSSDCVCCPGDTCQSASVFGWGWANCGGGSS